LIALKSTYIGNPLLHPVKVFIAEDEPSIAPRWPLPSIARDGRIIGPAGSVAEAKALLEETEPDIAILDVHLSDGEISSIAGFRADRSIPIIFLREFATASQARTSRCTGA
jgi:response regulator of citrate/malate metabolism